MGESAADAESIGGAIVAPGYRGFAPDATIVGDVEGVAASFRAYAEMGHTDVIIRNLVSDQEKALAGIARLARVREVIDGS